MPGNRPRPEGVRHVPNHAQGEGEEPANLPPPRQDVSVRITAKRHDSSDESCLMSKNKCLALMRVVLPAALITIGVGGMSGGSNRDSFLPAGVLTFIGVALLAQMINTLNTRQGDRVAVGDDVALRAQPQPAVRLHQGRAAAVEGVIRPAGHNGAASL